MIILFRENVIQTYLCAKVCTLCQPWHRELQIKHVWIFVLSSLKDGLNSDTLEVFFSTNGGLRSGWSISGLKSTLSHWFFWAIQRWTWCCVSDHCPAIWVLWPSHHDLTSSLWIFWCRAEFTAPSVTASCPRPTGERKVEVWVTHEEHRCV